MAKKKQTAAHDEKRVAAEYYKLNMQAVDDLVNANAENSPTVSEEELRKYQSGPKLKLADWVKALLIKAWFAGAVCFFFIWGLGYYLQDQLDQIVVVGLALGVVTDLMTNNVFRFLEKTPGANARWMMFPKKGYISFPLNILYAFLIIFCVVMTYNAINVGILAMTGAQDTVPLGVEPILFGVFATAWDCLFIKMKHTMRSMVEDAKKKAGR